MSSQHQTWFLHPDTATVDRTAYGFAQPRPVVVIDPEDREQIERLVDTVREFSGQGPATLTDRWQLALREFANPTPPKPDEPQGLGAVIEDDAGDEWVRFQAKTGWWWRDLMGRNRRWADFSDAVRVLSQGVTL